MPVHALDETVPSEKKKPPRRSWRSLPATPPVADPLPSPDATQLVTGWTDVTDDGDGGDTVVQPAVAAASPPPRSRRRTWVVAGGVALVGALAAGSVLALRDTSEPTAASTATTTPEGGSGSSGNGSVQGIVKDVSPAVVQLEPDGGVGTGVLFDRSGLVLTAHHVVAGVEELTVKLADGTEVAGRVVGRLPERDLAVVAVDAEGDLPVADLAGEGTVEVGEPVVAIGSPFGISQTVTSGIVSGLDREIDSPVGKLTGLIQTDAPINPGNSGGPLIDADAQVIGINSAIASTSGASAGVGFAVPVEEAADLIEQVRQAGGAEAPSVPDDSGSALGGSGPLDGLLPPELQDLLPGGLDGLLGGSGDPLELLQQLLEGLLEGDLGGLDPFAPDQGSADPAPPQAQESLGLIEVGELPDGWTQERNSVRTSSGSRSVEGTQDVVLSGPGGRVAIVAQRGPDAADAYDQLEGDAVDVAGTQGKAVGGSGLAWMLGDDLLVVVKADEGVAQRDVDQIVDAIEAVR